MAKWPEKKDIPQKNPENALNALKEWQNNSEPANIMKIEGFFANLSENSTVIATQVLNTEFSREMVEKKWVDFEQMLIANTENPVWLQEGKIA